MFELNEEQREIIAAKLRTLADEVEAGTTYGEVCAESDFNRYYDRRGHQRASVLRGQQVEMDLKTLRFDAYLDIYDENPQS